MPFPLIKKEKWVVFDKNRLIQYSAFSSGFFQSYSTLGEKDKLRNRIFSP